MNRKGFRQKDLDRMQAQEELNAIHHAVMNPMEVKPQDGDSFTVKRVKEFIRLACMQPGEVVEPPFVQSASGQTMSASDLLDELVRRAKTQEQINGGAWGVVAAWLEEHRIMVRRSDSTGASPEHVCGLQGYNPAIDEPCPGCVVGRASTRSKV